MSEVQISSYSLLNQREVDTLVGFLNDKKKSLDSDVMSQQSIDKLITLITNDSRNIILDLFDPFANVDPALLSTLNFREKATDLCELRYSIDPETDFIILTTHNTVTGEDLVLTPKLVNESDTDDWGYSISPTFFNRLARVFSLKYTIETHDAICNIFAEHTYGSKDHKIPEIYLPVNDYLLECLL